MFKRFLAMLIAYFFLAPFIVWSYLPLSEYSSFTAPSQILSFIPGIFGILLRRYWYKTMLLRCGDNLTVDWLAVIRTRRSEIGNRCTIGVSSWISWVSIGDDVMTGSHVVITSGAHQHSFERTDIPMRSQPGTCKQVCIENDVWIGANTVIMTAVSTGTVVGAGSVVTRTYEPFSIIAGNPAKLIRYR